MATTKTTCRICESGCGLLADVAEGRITALRPDPDHPVSRGYACVKGTRFAERVVHAPDRLVRPRVRGPDGVAREVGWAEALERVGSSLRRLVDAHGPEAVGLFSGNAMAFTLGGALGAAALQRALGTTKHYSSLTLDNCEVFVVAEEVFGDPMRTAVADYAGSDLVVLIGTDPLQSQASQAQSHPRATADLRERARQGQLVVVDPRRSVTAASASSHLAPRPGTDVFLLAWLLGRALERQRLGRMRPDEALVAATAPFATERVARVTGLPPEALKGLWARLSAAERPLVWSGLGVLLGPHGTLGWWLTVALQATLGGLGVPGGWRFPHAVGVGRWLRWLGVRGRDPAVRSVGGRPAILGTLPSAHLADDVLSDRPDRLRALIVFGGDPASSLPDTRRAAAALGALELLVSVDLFARGTAEQAHVALPAATFLEREETALQAADLRPAAHLRLDRPVLPPVGEARSDWEIALALCDAVGAPPLGGRALGAAARWLGPTGIARAAALVGRIPWCAVASEDGWSGATEQVPAARLAVPEWCDALAALPDPEPGLRLVTSVRPLGVMNHWLGARDGRREARVHPDDAAPGPATLRGAAGSLDVELVADPALARGTVLLPYGDRACNPNVLVGTAELEPFTGQPVSNGSRVEVLRRPEPPPTPGATTGAASGARTDDPR